MASAVNTLVTFCRRRTLRRARISGGVRRGPELKLGDSMDRCEGTLGPAGLGIQVRHSGQPLTTPLGSLVAGSLSPPGLVAM
jgi:hypothetical protein